MKQTKQFKNQKYASVKGAKIKNEDFFYVDDTLMIIGDGASGLGENYMDDEKSDAAWFCRNVVQRLSTLLKHENSKIESTLAMIVEDLKTAYEKKAGLGYNPDFSPSMCITIFRMREDFIEYYSLGDCTAVFKMADGGYDVIQDKSVPSLDEEVLALMKEKLEHKNYTTMRQTRLDEEIIKKLQENRKKRNTDTGYWILDIYGDGISHGVHKKIQWEGIENILLMTDGFYEGKEFFAKLELNDKQFYQLCEEMKLQDIADYIASQYRKDKECMEFKRVTSVDDVTAIYIEL